MEIASSSSLYRCSLEGIFHHYLFKPVILEGPAGDHAGQKGLIESSLVAGPLRLVSGRFAVWALLLDDIIDWALLSNIVDWLL